MAERVRSVRSRSRIHCSALVLALALAEASTTRVAAGHLETWYRLDEVLKGLKRVDVLDSTTYYAKAGWYYKLLSDENGRTVLRMLRHRDEEHQSVSGEVSEGGTYEVATSSLTDLHRTFVQGVSVGVLAVPFKYRLEAPGGDAVVTNSATIGASLGARFRLGSVISAILQPLVFAGFTRIPVSTTEPDPRERNGLTYGAGFVVDLGHDAQLGLVIGWDRIADGEPPNWPFQDRPWLSLGLGFKFFGG